jgi:hypothetical protein
MMANIINKQMKQAKHRLQQTLESALTMIGDVIPLSIGLKNPAIMLERMEHLLEQGSLRLEAFVERKIHVQHRKETIREQISNSPILPPHSVRIEESFEKGLSRDDVLKRLAEIDRIIITREQEQEIEH